MKRVVGIICFIIGVFLQFLRVLGDGFETVGAFGIPVTVLGVFLFVNSFDWSGRQKIGKGSNITHDVLKRLTEEDVPYSEQEKEIIKAYRHKEFPCDVKDILKVFFNEEGTMRYVFYQDVDIVRYVLEYLYLLDEDERNFPEEYAYWQVIGERNSICADLEIALREQAPYLKTFHEESIENLLEGEEENI